MHIFLVSKTSPFCSVFPICSLLISLTSFLITVLGYVVLKQCVFLFNAKLATILLFYNFTIFTIATIFFLLTIRNKLEPIKHAIDMKGSPRLMRNTGKQES